MKWDSPFDRVVSSLDLEDGSGIGKKAPFTRLIFLTAPLFRAKTKERLWSQQKALLDEKLAPGFFLILVLKRGMGAGGVKQDQNGLDRSAS